MFAPLGLGAFPHQSVLGPASGSTSGCGSVAALGRACMRAVKALAGAGQQAQQLTR